MQINQISTIAKNYAQALYEADIDNSLVISQLSDVINTIDSSEDLQIVLGNSSISCAKKIEILEDIFKNKIDVHLLNLLKLLTEKNRISELKGIYEALSGFKNKKTNKKNVEIVSAIELNNETKQRIIEKLNKKLNCDIMPLWQIDKSIIAGLVFKYDDYVIDTSVLAKLKQLSKQ